MNKRRGLNSKVYIPLLILLAVGNLSLVAVFAWPGLQPAVSSPAAINPDPQTSTPTLAPIFNLASTDQPTSTNVPTPTLPPAVAQDGLRQQGIIFLSMSDGANIHLFAYHPQFLAMTRLTNNPWDDINPVVSPDGKKIAYSSHQNGYWDLYLFDLASGKSSRLTDTPEYEAPESWSPDGQWLAIERLVENRLQIFLLPVADKNSSPVQLTNFDAPSYEPQWSPKGREIAFVSTKDGKEDIWLARLDRIDDRFINLTGIFPGNHRQPRWSPDSSLLAWSADKPDGMVVETWSPTGDDLSPHMLGPGTNPVWEPAGNAVLAEVRQANATSITAYKTSNGELLFPLTHLPAALFGMDWKEGAAVDLLSALKLPDSFHQPAAALWQKKISASPAPPQGRYAIVALKDVTVPYPFLEDSIDEAFKSLRELVSQETGWDFLANLENAYVPMTVASPPDMEENWLYTGRAIAVNPVPLNAGWMVTVREDIAGQTFWRVFLRARFQDGSQGMPLTMPAWDLNARNSGNPSAYDQGGEYSSVPEGYWVDFTELAARIGWDRFPALVDWRTFYQASRFNLFALRENMDWRTAMGQLYPPEALATPTPLITLTITPKPTLTPWYYKYVTPSLTPSLTLTPTRRPTLTLPGPSNP